MTKEKEIQLASKLAKAMIGVQATETRFWDLSKDINPTHGLKRQFSRWANQLQKIKTEFVIAFDSQDMQKAKEEMLNDEVSLQLEEINTNLLAIPKVKRDEIEEIVKEYHKKFKLV